MQGTAQCGRAIELRQIELEDFDATGLNRLGDLFDAE